MKTEKTTVSPQRRIPSYDPSQFTKPLEMHFIKRIMPKSPLVIGGYDAIKKDVFTGISRHFVKCESETYKKEDQLFISKACYWAVVKSQARRRNEVREQGLRPESGLAVQLDTKKNIDPYIFMDRGDRGVRKPLPVKVVLRNGLVVSCKLVGEDEWNLIARCKDVVGNRGYILLYKHGILGVEPVEESVQPN